MSSSVRRAWLVAICGLLAIAATANAAPKITEYSVAHASVFPCSTAFDKRTGKIYFSAMFGPTRTSTGSIGVLDPDTGAVRKIPLTSGVLAALGGIAFGPDDRIYFAEYLAGNAIGRLDPRKNDEIVEFPLPHPQSQPGTLVRGPDDGIWFVESGSQLLGRFDVYKETFEEDPLPGAGANIAFEMMNRGDGRDLLLGLPNTNQIAVFNVDDRKFTTYTSPTPLSVPQGEVRLSWQIDRSGEEPQFRLTWRELGGPAVSTPTRRGFGELLVRRIAPRDVAGRSTVNYDSQGFQYDLDAPLKELIDTKGDNMLYVPLDKLLERSVSGGPDPAVIGQGMRTPEVTTSEAPAPDPRARGER